MSKWSHITSTAPLRSGSDNITNYSGFVNEQELNEFIQYYKNTWYVYFPRFSNIKEENGVWSCTLSEAQSCD
jgi:hypothetical protein